MQSHRSLGVIKKQCVRHLKHRGHSLRFTRTWPLSHSARCSLFLTECQHILNQHNYLPRVYRNETWRRPPPFRHTYLKLRCEIKGELNFINFDVIDTFLDYPGQSRILVLDTWPFTLITCYFCLTLLPARFGRCGRPFWSLTSGLTSPWTLVDPGQNAWSLGHLFSGHRVPREHHITTYRTLHIGHYNSRNSIREKIVKSK